jgi:hypothetical protein
MVRAMAINGVSPLDDTMIRAVISPTWRPFVMQAADAVPFADGNHGVLLVFTVDGHGTSFFPSTQQNSHLASAPS